MLEWEPFPLLIKRRKCIYKWKCKKLYSWKIHLYLEKHTLEESIRSYFTLRYGKSLTSFSSQKSQENRRLYSGIQYSVLRHRFEYNSLKYRPFKTLHSVKFLWIFLITLQMLNHLVSYSVGDAMSFDCTNDSQSE